MAIGTAGKTNEIFPQIPQIVADLLKLTQV
jgi:hypothetical protein